MSHAAKTHCPKGHPYDAVNTRVYTYPKTGRTQRVCRACSDERARRYRLKSLYGVSLEDYNLLFEKQQGLCAICFKPSPRLLDVDHDHESGVVRGLLCNQHNQALGLFGEDISLLQAAIHYLERQ